MSAAATSPSTAQLTIEEALTLHKALHVPGATSTPSLRGGAIAAGTIERKSATKLRFIRLPPPFSLEIVEQNPTKVSKWAKLAASGHAVSWFIRRAEKWALCVDDDVMQHGQCIAIAGLPPPISGGSSATHRRASDVNDDDDDDESSTEELEGGGAMLPKTPTPSISASATVTAATPATATSITSSSMSSSSSSVIKPTTSPPPPTIAAATPAKPLCKYGKSCYRTNLAHLQAFAHPHLDALVQAQSKKHALSSSDHAVSSASAAVASTADDDAAGDPTLPLEAGADDAAKHSAKRPRLDADGFAVPSAVESRPTISLPTSVTEIDWAHIKLGALIGKGAMGAVNRAAYAMPDSDGVVLDVAVKQLHQSADGELPQKEIDRFRSELILLSRLKHDNIVKCFGGILSSSATSPLAIVMEYVGETLKRRISRSGGLVGKLALADLVEISTGMARGIAFLHAQAIIHRDVKPGNCLLLGNVAKLCDFGISRAHEGTSAMTRIGTPTFMAPEVLRGEAYSTKADIYSMGMILWQMTSAEQPFGKPGAGDGDGDAADAFNVIMKAAVQHSRPDFLPITPAPLVELIDACWHRVPAARPCADELVAALEAIDTSN